MEKAVSCYKADRLVYSLDAKFPQRSVVACSTSEFRAAGKERCERGHGRVCANLSDVVVPNGASAQSQLCELSGPTFGFTTREFSIVGGYTESPEKHQNCQNSSVVLVNYNFN